MGLSHPLRVVLVSVLDGTDVTKNKEEKGESRDSGYSFLSLVGLFKATLSQRTGGPEVQGS